jgi:YHS domain-containing protein
VIKIITFVVAAGILYLLTKSKLKKLAGDFLGGGEKKDQHPVLTTDMEKDPICNTYVQQETPYRLKYYGKVYYFCSQECMDKFKEKKG